jgi:hypothetical protein
MSLRNPPGLLAVALLMLVLLAGCGGKPFNVKPRPDLAPATYTAEESAGGISVKAVKVTDEDLLYETFDASLILAGLLPVRIEVANATGAAIELKKAKFELRSAAGRRYKALKAKDAFKKLISYYGITTYSKDGYRESQEDFISYALDTAAPLAAGDKRAGMIFFAVPSELAASAELILVGEKLNRSASIELKLQ